MKLLLLAALIQNGQAYSMYDLNNNDKTNVVRKTANKSIDHLDQNSLLTCHTKFLRFFIKILKTFVSCDFSIRLTFNPWLTRIK